MSGFLILLRKFREDTAGIAAVWTTLLAVIIFSLTALTVDGSWIYYNRARLQATADASALAAAGNPDDYLNAANSYAETNMPSVDNGDVLADADIVPGTWDQDTRTFDPTGTPVDAYQVTTRKAAANANALPLFFAQILGSSSIDLLESATAITYRSKSPTSACILTLSDLDLSITAYGNTKVSAIDCSIMSNSTADPSIKQTGNADVTAECVYAAGEITEKGGITTLGCPEPVPNVPQVIDPYADITVPNPLPPCRTDALTFGPSETVDLTPNDTGTGVVSRFCDDVKFQGVVNLAPGTYYFTGSFQINSGATVTGDGVTLVMTSDTATSSSQVIINGDSSTTLTAPTTGEYAGILIYQDRDVTWSADSRINGTSAMGLTGALYFPESGLTINGDSDTEGDGTGCLQIIADTISFSGTGYVSVANNCEGTGTKDIEIYGALQVMLVD